VEVLGAALSSPLSQTADLCQDTFFDNVCELDLVFNFYKVRHPFVSNPMTLITQQVYAILDEIFLAGEIEETSKDVVLARLDELEKLE